MIKVSPTVRLESSPNASSYMFLPIDYTHNHTARMDHNNGEDLASPSLKERRRVKAPLSGNALLPDVGTPPQRTQRPQTRPRRPKPSSARAGGSAGRDFTSALQATSSKSNWQSNRVTLRPIRKHYPSHPLRSPPVPLTLPNKLS